MKLFHLFSTTRIILILLLPLSSNAFTLSHAPATTCSGCTRRTIGATHRVGRPVVISSQLASSPSNDDDDNNNNNNNSNNDDTDTDTSNGARAGSLMEATLREGRVPYGETSRKYRQTEFSYNDWVRHRNSDKKITTNIKGMFFSGIIRQLKEEIIVVTFAAACVVLWNNVLLNIPIPSSMDIFSSSSSLSDMADMTMYLPKLVLPALPFTLSSPALGLLLVFKTNASYARWLEARNTWAKIVSQARNTVRMASTFVSAELTLTLEGKDGSKESIEDLSKAMWLLCRCLMNALSDPTDEKIFREEVRDMFGPSDDGDDINGNDDGDNIINGTNGATEYKQNTSIVPNILQSTDRTMAALVYASQTLDKIPIDEKRRVEIDKSLVIIGDCISVCEKIYSSPVPLVYTRHTGRFLSLWMILLPTALYDAFVVKDVTALSTTLGNLQCLAIIPTTAIVGLFLFGIDELAIQLEEPFSILPMQTFCNDVQKATNTIEDWSFGTLQTNNRNSSSSSSSREGAKILD